MEEPRPEANLLWNQTVTLHETPPPPSSETSTDTTRQVGFALFGAPTGTPVVYLHGLPGSRFEGLLWDKAAFKLNIKLIALDRPGLGLSQLQSNRTLKEYPKDVACVVERLHLEQYYILGVSGGGPYAIACASQEGRSLLPGLQYVGVAAGLGPRNLPNNGMGIIQRMSFLAMDWVPGGLVGWFWDVMLGRAARNPDPMVFDKKIKAAFAGAKGPEMAIYDDPDVVKAMTASLRGAFAQGGKGYVREAEIVSQDWGFELGSVSKVRMWYGEKDTLAPPAVGEALTARIPDAVCEVMLGETHTTLIALHQERILKQLLGQVVESESSNI